MKQLLQLGFILAVLAASACGSTPALPNDKANEPIIPTLAVTGARVVQEPIRERLELFGTTVAQRQIWLRAPAAGLISGLSLHPGDRVVAGQVVARLTTREEMAAAAGAAMVHQFDQREARAINEAVRRNAGPSSGIPLVVAEGGIVSRRLVSNGQFVNEFDNLVELIDPRSIYVEAAAPLEAVRRIRVGMAAEVDCPILPGPANARVAAILPSFSPGSQTSPVRISFETSTPLVEAGVAVEVWLVTTYHPKAFTIPKAALFVNPVDDTDYVFVAGSDGVAHRRTVHVGLRESDRVEVSEGLKPAELVITSGGYALSDGLRVQIDQSGHGQ